MPGSNTLSILILMMIHFLWESRKLSYTKISSAGINLYPERTFGIDEEHKNASNPHKLRIDKFIMVSVDILSLAQRCWLWVVSVLVMSMIADVRSDLFQKRINYIVAAGTIATGLNMFCFIPIEFFDFTGRRWFLFAADTITWMLYFAAAVIASDDIKTCDAALNAGVLTGNVCKVVRATTAFAWCGFAFSLLLSVYEIYLAKKENSGVFAKRTPTQPLGKTGLGTNEVNASAV